MPFDLTYVREEALSALNNEWFHYVHFEIKQGRCLAHIYDFEKTKEQIIPKKFDDVTQLKSIKDAFLSIGFVETAQPFKIKGLPYAERGRGRPKKGEEVIKYHNNKSVEAKEKPNKHLENKLKKLNDAVAQAKEDKRTHYKMRNIILNPEKYTYSIIKIRFFGGKKPPTMDGKYDAEITYTSETDLKTFTDILDKSKLIALGAGEKPPKETIMTSTKKAKVTIQQAQGTTS